MFLNAHSVYCKVWVNDVTESGNSHVGLSTILYAHIVYAGQKYLKKPN